LGAVEACGDGAALLEEADGAFDDVAPSVAWKSSGGSSGCSLCSSARCGMTGVMERSESHGGCAERCIPCHRAVYRRTASAGGAPAVARRSSSRVAGGRNQHFQRQPVAIVRRWIFEPQPPWERPSRLRSPFFSARSGASGAEFGAIDAPVSQSIRPSSSSCRRSTARMRAKVRRAPSGENGRRRLPRAVAFRQIAPPAPCSTSRTSRPATRGGSATARRDHRSPAK